MAAKMKIHHADLLISRNASWKPSSGFPAIDDQTRIKKVRVKTHILIMRDVVQLIQIGTIRTIKLEKKARINFLTHNVLA